MTIDLVAFQSGLACALRGEDTCPVNRNSGGFRFTGAVRRSWCELRTLSAARAVLALVPVQERRRLIADYVDCGGGVAAFPATESETLMAFLAQRLPDPSHALTVCRMEMALVRAQAGTVGFAPSKSSGGRERLEMGPCAALVWCHADPGAISLAINGGPVPPMGAPDYPVFFAPGLPNCVRAAMAEEAVLWTRLPTSDMPTGLVRRLLADGVITIAGPPGELLTYGIDCQGRGLDDAEGGIGEGQDALGMQFAI